MHAAPMYIAETAPSHIRGRLISLKEFFIVIGMVVSVQLPSFPFGWFKSIKHPFLCRQLDLQVP